MRTLDIGLLQAGASMKGEFEQRLRGVIDEVQASPKPIILFIDEVHRFSKSQQDAIMALGLEAEKFGTQEAIADDKKVAEVYAAKGAKIADLDEKIVDKWRAIARDTAWKDYAQKTALSAELLKLAEGVHVS